MGFTDIEWIKTTTGRWKLMNGETRKLSLGDHVQRPDGLLMRFNGRAVVNWSKVLERSRQCKARAYQDPVKRAKIQEQNRQCHARAYQDPVKRSKIQERDRQCKARAYQDPVKRAKKQEQNRQCKARAYQDPVKRSKIQEQDRQCKARAYQDPVKRAKKLERDRQCKARAYQDPVKRAKIQEQNRVLYYKKRGYKPGDIRIKKFEYEMIDFLLVLLPDADLILGKSVGNLCTENHTHRFPDVQLLWKGFMIVFECDENAHRGAAYSCDWKRMNEIAISQGCPVWFIRWNPHAGLPLETLAQEAKGVMTLTPEEIQWEYRKQFNVTYIGFNDTQLERQDARRKFAEQPVIAAFQFLTVSD